MLKNVVTIVKETHLRYMLQYNHHYSDIIRINIQHVNCAHFYDSRGRNLRMCHCIQLCILVL